MKFLTTIYYILSVPLLLYSLYFFITGFATFKKDRKKVGTYPAEKRFAILIAARNEEKVISNLIDSLKQQTYPSHLYDIFVIPNNCTDHTESAALLAGSRILHVKLPVRTKGDVLKQAFAQLQGSGYDGYVIFDADNVVSPNFLQRMNDALCAGYPAAQGRRDGKNPKVSWVSGCYTIYYGTLNFFINRSRMNLTRNANISGTGFMISDELLVETGYPIKTITEDMEYTILCALKNKSIAFIEDAVFFDEQPVKFFTSVRQRKRWSAGAYLCFYIYFARLFKAAWKNKNKSALDILLLAFTPLFQVLITLLSVIITIGAIISQGIYSLGSSMIGLLGLLGFGVGYIFQMLFAGMIVVMQCLKIKDRVIGILTFPLFMLSWIPINFYCLFKTNVGWEPIEHSHLANIHQIYSDISSSKQDHIPKT